MKSKRHLKIMDLVKDKAVQTQEDLTNALKEEGIDVTQATISRDIKQLGLIKIPMKGGGYKYSLPPKQREKINATSRMKRMFQDSVVNIDYSENLIVINTLPGTAQGIAALLDSTEWDKVIGTIAGDDTILIIVKPKDAVDKVLEKLESLTL
ncbi:arginine repressor [Halonatronum saccharophilum]|uniref:arginine repressor n=1 Tax=Halonatronum saccharophilum TaxID=150060 RepID=UPI0004817F9F|nr:arginine repressor [Halonatronum saccharophilum]